MTIVRLVGPEWKSEEQWKLYLKVIDKKPGFGQGCAEFRIYRHLWGDGPWCIVHFLGLLCSIGCLAY